MIDLAGFFLKYILFLKTHFLKIKDFRRSATFVVIFILKIVFFFIL